MTPEQDKKFNILFGLFKSEGWEIFQSEVKTKWEAMKFNMVDQSPEKWPEIKGYIGGLAFALIFEELVKNEYNNQIESDADDAA
jgi:hypothetical protein